MLKDIKIVGSIILWFAKFIKNSTAFLFNLCRNCTGPLRFPFVSDIGTRVLAPGDPNKIPVNKPDMMDYRGTAIEAELGQLRNGGVSLGFFTHPRGKRGGPLTLPISLLQRGCAVIGPTGSGKTEGLIIPWIIQLLGMGASVLTCDVKGDLYNRIYNEAKRTGSDVWYWSISDPSLSKSWNWMDELLDDRDIEAATQSILGRPKPGDTQPFFYERDYRWLRTLIQIVKTAYQHTAKPWYLYNLVSDQASLRALFAQTSRIQHYASELSDLLQFSVDEYSRAVSGLLNALHLFNTKAVKTITERSDFSLQRINKSPTLLIIGAALADGRATEVMSGIFFNQMINVVYKRLTNNLAGGVPLYFIIDEAPRLKDRINYEEVLSVVRSAKVGVCLAAQDVNQFGDQRQQSAILTNCLTFIAMRGVSFDTAKYLSERLGQRNESSIALNKNRGPFDFLSTYGNNQQAIMVPVLGEREIMYPPGPTYTAIIQSEPVSMKPFIIDLTKINSN
jgi:type IV secretion system protein VirD4